MVEFQRKRPTDLRPNGGDQVTGAEYRAEATR
jgi:hypothetical protein